jgi:hypothetical protein
MIMASPIITAEEKTQITTALNQGFKQAGLQLSGFSTQDVALYLFGGTGNVQLAEAEAVQRASLGLGQTPATLSAASLIDPVRLKPGAGTYNLGWGDIPYGLQHLAEHPKGSHYSGDFNIGKFVSNVVGVMTFGFAPDLTSFFSALGSGRLDFEKIQFNVPFSGAGINKYTHDVVDLYSGQQASKAATPILDSPAAKILDTVAGATAAAIVGYGAYNYGSLAAASSGVGAGGSAASPALIGVTEASLSATPSYTFPIYVGAEATSYAGAGVTAASLTGTGIVEGGILSTIGSGVLAVGKFVGGAALTGYLSSVIGGGKKAINDLLHGNVDKAINDFTSGFVPGSTPSGTNQPYAGGVGSGGYGGGGTYYGGAANTQQASMFSTLLPMSILAGVILLFLYFYKRK